MKTEISGQNFRLRRAIFLSTCVTQVVFKFINLILITYVYIFVSLRYMYIKFVIKFGDASRRQSSIWTKNSLNCVQKTMKTMNLRKKITMKTMKMGKNNHENHEKLLKNG